MTIPNENCKKAVLSNRIYLDINSEDFNSIDAALTYKIPSFNPAIMPATIIKNCRKISKNIISIPIGRQDLIPKGTIIVDKRVEVFADFPDPKWPLNSYQLSHAADMDDSGILNAPVGWGKTFTALHIARNLGQRTLIVVHNLSLRDQWEKEIQKIFGFSPGVIGSGEFNIHNVITVANVQTLVNCMDRVEAVFGTVILDEAHHVPATTFAKVMDRLKCRYKIGLTGTLKRKDGRQVVFTDYFGPKLIQPKSDNVMVPRVQVLSTNIFLPQGDNWSARVTELLDNQDYIELIAAVASTKADIGHKVLVLSDRLKFQRKLGDILGDRAVTVDGATKLEDRAKAHAMLANDEKDILNGTLSIYKEGISEAYLSCLICVTPINNEGLLEQLMGRVMRKGVDKLQPIIIDIRLKETAASQTVRLQYKNRLQTYMSLGYEIEEL